jgi:endogenous inhibitor of DNA gyrase (YacG/DUF329 family)
MGEEYEYGDPCPECGHDEYFGETCKAHGVTYFDDDGNVESFEVGEMGEPLIVECPECETELMNKLE